jgi:hypothetical protein
MIDEWDERDEVVAAVFDCGALAISYRPTGRTRYVLAGSLLWHSIKATLR